MGLLGLCRGYRGIYIYIYIYIEYRVTHRVYFGLYGRYIHIYMYRTCTV